MALNLPLKSGVRNIVYGQHNITSGPSKADLEISASDFKSQKNTPVRFTARGSVIDIVGNLHIDDAPGKESPIYMVIEDCEPLSKTGSLCTATATIVAFGYATQNQVRQTPALIRFKYDTNVRAGTIDFGDKPEPSTKAGDRLQA